MRGFVVRLYRAVRETLRQYPAATAALLNIGVVLFGYLGLNVTGEQLIYLVAIATTLFSAFVHQNVTPLAKLEKKELPILSITFKPGVRSQDLRKPRLFFRSFRKPGIVAPESVDYTRIPVIGMLGNDRYGCCVYTGNAHTIEEQTFFGQGAEYVITTEQVLAAYSLMTSFDPADPSTDQGDTVQNGLNFLRKYGWDGHTIAAFAELDPSDINDVRLAVAEFGAVAVGMAFPAFAMDQFNSREPWSISTKNTVIEGGHRVVLVGYDADYLYVFTWNAVQKMTYAFWNKYVADNSGEAWATIGLDWINKVTGLNPAGIDKFAFGAQFAALTGESNPFPEPPLPPEPESPDEAESNLVKAAHRYLSRWAIFRVKYLADALRAWLTDKGW